MLVSFVEYTQDAIDTLNKGMLLYGVQFIPTSGISKVQLNLVPE
jgi:hypothetical protein